MEDEKKELLRKLADSNRALQNFAHGPIAADNDRNSNDNSANEIRKLQDDLNQMTKKNHGENFESNSKIVQRQSEISSFFQCVQVCSPQTGIIFQQFVDAYEFYYCLQYL